MDLWTEPHGVTSLLARWTEKLAGGTQTPLENVMEVDRQQPGQIAYLIIR